MAIINIRESLLALDKKTSGKYELTTLYEACKLDEKDKEQLVKYIDTKEPPFMIGQFLTDKCGSCLGEAVEDDVTEAEKLKFIDDINDGADHSLWALMDDADEKDNKLTEATLAGTNCNNSKQVRTYLYDKIRKFDEFTDDNSRYWDLDVAISEGDDAVLIPDGSKAPKGAKYMFSFVNEEVNIDVFLDRTSDNDTWYVVDNQIIAESAELTEDYDVVTMNDKYFPRVDISDTARYDYVQYKGRDFAYDKKDNVLHFLFKDEEEIEVMGGIEKTPFRSLDAAGLSADNWNDTEERDYYLDQYASDIDAETSYLVQDFIQNELPYYQKQGLVDSLDAEKVEEGVKDIDAVLDTLGGRDAVKARIEDARRAYPGIEDDELIDMLWNEGSREDWESAVEYLSEATATAERPLSALGGTLSSVLLAHKDEVNTLFTAKDAVEFLDRIRPEVKNVGYVDKVKADIMRKRGIIPVQYFYNIILKGDGQGTDKGGVVSKKSQIKRWAAQPAMESVEDDADKPYTYTQVFDELRLETKNFTVEEDTCRYGFKEEAEMAEKILSKHYRSVELDKVGSWFQIDFKDRILIKGHKKVTEAVEYVRWVQLPDGKWKMWGSNPGPELDPNFLDRAREQNNIDYKDAKVSKNGEYPEGVDESNSIKEGLNDYRFEVTCNDGPTKVISTVAENEERAINYVKKYYAQEHTTYADDRANKWTIKNLYDGKEYTESVNPADLTDCPECGDTSFDSKRGRCTKCSYREELEESYRGDELTELLDWLQTYNDGELWDSFVVEFEDVEDDMLDPEDILSWLESYDKAAYDGLMSSELYESKSIKESFPRNIDLDQVVIQVANLVDDKALGDNWIEVFPTRDASPIVGGEYYVSLEITGPEDITKRATFRTRNGRVEVAFLNGSEAMCDSAEEIARFIAGEFGLTIGKETPFKDLIDKLDAEEEVLDAEVHDYSEDELRKMGAFDNLNIDESVALGEDTVEMTADEMKDKFGTDNPDIINTGRPEEDGTIALKEEAEVELPPDDLI